MTKCPHCGHERHDFVPTACDGCGVALTTVAPAADEAPAPAKAE